MATQSVKNVLVVDDSIMELRTLARFLGDNGFAPIIAKNGQDAIAQARKCHPDLILMDIVMPLMNGFEATRALQADPELAKIPVILISAKDQPTDRIWGYRQGASEYLVKPVSGDRLLTAIDEIKR